MRIEFHINNILLQSHLFPDKRAIYKQLFPYKNETCSLPVASVILRFAEYAAGNANLLHSFQFRPFQAPIFGVTFSMDK